MRTLEEVMGACRIEQADTGTPHWSMTPRTAPYAPSTHCQHGVRWHLSCPACLRATELVLQVRAAHGLLDRVREGLDAAPADVACALRLVGEGGASAAPRRVFDREGA